MQIDEISGFDTNTISTDFDYSKATLWNNREVKSLEKEDRGIGFVKTVLENSARKPSSDRIKLPMDSAGGSVSAEKKEDGNSQVNGEVHITTKSDDGNTSVTVTGEASVDNEGNSSGKVEVKIEHEF